MVDLLPYFVVLWDLKIKSKSSGLPDSNFIFFVATKKTKQKKAWRCAGHVWRVKAATSIQILPIDQEPTFPPQDPRLLRASPFVVDCSGRYFFSFFPVDHTAREAPSNGPAYSALALLDVAEIRQRRCPPQGAGTFAYFCCRTKVWRRAGRDPPVLSFKITTRATDEQSAALSFVETSPAR